VGKGEGPMLTFRRRTPAAAPTAAKAGWPSCLLACLATLPLVVWRAGAARQVFDEICEGTWNPDCLPTQRTRGAAHGSRRARRIARRQGLVWSTTGVTSLIATRSSSGESSKRSDFFRSAVSSPVPEPCWAASRTQTRTESPLAASKNCLTTLVLLAWRDARARGTRQILAADISPSLEAGPNRSSRYFFVSRRPHLQKPR
jgi:hypothetical protein